MAPAKHQVTASVQASERRASSMERRAAQLAALATQQSDLKAEAAEREKRRDAAGKGKAPTSGPSPAGRRSNAR